MKDSAKYRLPSLPVALIPIISTLVILGIQLFYFGDFTPQIPLVIGLAITGLVGIKLGRKWYRIEDGMFHVIRVAMPSIAVLLCVGMLIAVWIASGTVPTLIYYGLTLLSPTYFLASAVLLCSVVSLSLGTSWGTVGTVGLALVGIGAGFDIPIYWTAGAVVSGAYFGDKMSPLSDTTNLAPAVTGTDLYSHIRNMMPTTVPALMIAFVIYLVAGFTLFDFQDTSLTRIGDITASLQEHFVITPWLLLPALVVFVLAVKRMPPIPSLFAGVIAGALIAMVVQGVSLHDIFVYSNSGYKIDSGSDAIDTLLNRGGIQSMMWTISLVLIALAFGGALEKTRCLEVIVGAIISKVRGFGGVQTAAIGSALFTNAVSDTYLAIALPGRMYSPIYRGMGYSTLNLSRALEEGGTMTAPLIPWNANGAFVISALGLGIAGGQVENLLYIPLAFACWISPILGIFYANTGLFSPKATDEEIRSWHHDEEAIADMSEVHWFDEAEVPAAASEATTS